MMMAKKVKNRYKNCTDLLVDLRALKNGEVPPIAHRDVLGEADLTALAAAEAASGADVTVWSRQAATIDLAGFNDVKFASGDISAAVGTLDIIHDHGLWLPSNHASARVGRHRRIPRVVSPRGMLESWSLKHRRIKKKIAWQLYQHRDLRSAACLHATSASEEDQFRRLGFRQPIIRIPNGVSLPVDLTSNEKLKPRKEVLFLSRIHPVKGLLNLLEAWQQSVCSEWRLKIVGSDECGHLAELKKKCAALQLRDSVEFCEAVHSEKKWQLIKDAALLALPSFSENFGIVVAEALGVGTPVLTTTGTPWNDITNRQCGWYVEPTVEAIASGLRQAMSTSRIQLAEMGQRGRLWMKESFSWDDIGRRMLSSYDQLLNNELNTSDVVTAPVRRAA